MEVYCYMKRKHILLVLAAVLVLSLCGCMPEYVDANDYIVYEADAPRDVTRITAVVTADDIAQLEQYPALVRADLTGSTCYDQLLEYRLSHPDVTVIYNVNLLGKEYTLDTVSINLSEMDPAKVHEVAKLLPHFSSAVVSPGSTDVGDVSWLTPTAQFSAVTWPSCAPGHSWQIVSAGKSALAHKGMILAAKVLAGVTADLMTKPQILTDARAEFEISAADGYDCPIGPEVTIPQA